MSTGTENKDVSTLAIANSYKGLLRVSSSDVGMSLKELTVYTSEGTDSCLKLSTTSATITGNLAATGTITGNTIDCKYLTVAQNITFKTDINFIGDTVTVSGDTAFICEKGATLEVKGTTSIANASISEATAASLIVTGGLEIAEVITADMDEINIGESVTFNCSGPAFFKNTDGISSSLVDTKKLTTNTISSTTTSGTIQIESPVKVVNAATFTGKVTVGDVTGTDGKTVDFTNTEVIAKTQSPGDSSTKVATTRFVTNAINSYVPSVAATALFPKYNSAKSVTAEFLDKITNGKAYVITENCIFMIHRYDIADGNYCFYIGNNSDVYSNYEINLGSWTADGFAIFPFWVKKGTKIWQMKRQGNKNDKLLKSDTKKWVFRTIPLENVALD